MDDMEAVLDDLGLGRFPRMDDDTAAASIERVEEIIEAHRGNVPAAPYLAQLQAFVYGYRLGARPKDTQHEIGGSW